jgi:hypothetical protein
VIITPAQCKFGRNLLRWSFEAVAQKVKLTAFHIARFEAGKPGILFMEDRAPRRGVALRSSPLSGLAGSVIPPLRTG